MDFEIVGLTELDVLLSDMSLAAACEAFVKDPGSSVSYMIEGMRWRYGVMDPSMVIRDSEDQQA